MLERHEEIQKQNPFQREYESVGELDLKRWVHSRLLIVEDISYNQNVFRTESNSRHWCYPKNEENCFNYGRCPFLRLCWESEPEEWFNPSIELLADFEPRPADYVNDIERMQKEELK